MDLDSEAIVSQALPAAASIPFSRHGSATAMLKGSMFKNDWKLSRSHIERLFQDWLDRPLAGLGRQPTPVVKRHDKTTKENGPYIAIGAIRSWRAVYDHVRKSDADLLAANPSPLSTGKRMIDATREWVRTTSANGRRSFAQWKIR